MKQSRIVFHNTVNVSDEHFNEFTLQNGNRGGVDSFLGLALKDCPNI